MTPRRIPEFAPAGDFFGACLKFFSGKSEKPSEASILGLSPIARPPWGGEDCSPILPAVLLPDWRRIRGQSFSLHKEAVVAKVCL